MDIPTLEPWIRREHLKDDVVGDHRRRFRTDPARTIVLDEFLQPEVAETLHRFLRGDARYRTEHGLYSAEHGVSAEQWDAAPDDDRFFRFGKLSHTKVGAEFNDSTLTYLRFRSFVQSEPMKDYLARIADLDLAVAPDEVGVHAFAPGDFLRRHDDDNRNRRLAFIFYLTPGWTREAGGALHMASGDEVRVFVPHFNSLVAFDVAAGTSHHVDAVTEAAPAPRYTIGGWYHRPARS